MANRLKLRRNGGPDRMVRVGFIGTGGIAQTHLRSLATVADASIVAVCDVAPERAQQAASSFGAKAYTDYRQMLEHEQLQAIFLCVPPFAHGTIEEEVVKKGIHLLVEKPLGLRMDAVRRKQAAIEQAGVIAAAGYCVRYSHLVEKVREWLGQGFATALAEAHYWGGGYSPVWWRNFDQSGGQLVEQATHVVDLLRYLVGEVEEVHAHYTRVAAPEDPKFTVPTACSLSLKFRDGAVGTVTTSCVVGASEAGVNLLGPAGAIHYTYGEARLVKGASIIVERPVGDMYTNQAQAFVKAVASGDRSLIRSTYADAARTLALTLAANQSAAEGRPIKL